MAILVQNPKQFFNIVYQEAKMYLSTELAYRWQVFIWVISDALQPLILGTVWASVAKNGGIFSVSHVVTYFLLVTVVSKLTKDWSVNYITNTVINGEFSKYLLKPFNYLAEMFGISIGSRMLRIIFLIPVLITAFMFFGNFIVLTLTFEKVMLAILALIIAFVINFLLGNTFSLLSFFIQQIIGLRTFYEHAVIFLSGEGIPLSAYPQWILFYVELLPFRYTLSFPIEVLMGKVTGARMFEGFVISIVWVIILVITYKVLFRYVLKNYEAFGG